MSNRIEDAIRQLILKRRQQDALLENIIKQSLLTEVTYKAKTKPLSNKQLAFAKSQGAEYAYGVVFNTLPKDADKRLKLATDATLDSATDSRSDRVSIDASSKFAKGTSDVNINLNDPKEKINLPNYIYYLRDLYDDDNPNDPDLQPLPTRKSIRRKVKNDKFQRGRYKLQVWIIPISEYLKYFKFKGKYKGIKFPEPSYKIGDSYVVEENYWSSVMTAQLTKIADGTMNELNNFPPKWGQITVRHPSLEDPNRQQRLSMISRGMGVEFESTKDVTNVKWRNGIFTGKWDIISNGPSDGELTTETDIYTGTWMYDSVSDTFWLS